jgi:predicted ATPase
VSLGHEQAFARDTFIGREAEIGLLRRALVDASGGRGRLVLLSGEPGIGKTRTCEELAAYAQAHRARVLWGRCYEGEGAPAFWPWVQILRSSPKTDANDLGLSLDAGGLDIAPIVAQVRQRHADPLGTVDDESPRARFRLFDSLARLFERIARASPPLLLIIDDLHGADRSSLLLLQFVAREMRAMPLLIVGAYRDVSLKADDALTETVVEALREPGTERLVLNGFSAAEIARCIEMSAGVRPAAALVAALHQQTGGNPLFVTELLRVFLAEHDLVAIRDGDAAVATSIPRTVKAVIGRRLAPLSTACNAVLATACVLGRDFRLDVLEQVASTQSAETLQALDEAVAARVLVRLRERVERYRFSHAVVRETLYENLSMAQRLRLHRRVADALEQLPDVEDH